MRENKRHTTIIFPLMKKNSDSLANLYSFKMKERRNVHDVTQDLESTLEDHFALTKY